MCHYLNFLIFSHYPLTLAEIKLELIKREINNSYIQKYLTSHWTNWYLYLKEIEQATHLPQTPTDMVAVSTTKTIISLRWGLAYMIIDTVGNSSAGWKGKMSLINKQARLVWLCIHNMLPLWAFFFPSKSVREVSSFMPAAGGEFI